MSAIKLGCHSWTFKDCTVRETAKIIKALGIDYMDLGNGPDFNPDYIADHVKEESARLVKIKEETGITYIDAFPQFKDSFTLNHPERDKREENHRVLSMFFKLAEIIGLKGVTLSPGKCWVGEASQISFQRSIKELNWAVAAGSKYKLKIRIEPHIQSVTWRPKLAVKMVQEVPGLTLTIDYSHFIFHGIPQEQIAIMHPYGSHWHARQAKLGQAQCKTNKGEINFEKIIENLKKQGYEGFICLEYVNNNWMGLDNVDCVTETIKLKKQLIKYL